MKPVPKLISHVRANVVAYLALFIALTTTAWAAPQIGTRQIARDAVTSKKIRAAAVKRQDIALAAVNGSRIADGTVGQADLAVDVTAAPSGRAGGDLEGSFPDPQIATGSVGTAAIADGGIRLEDLAAWEMRVSLGSFGMGPDSCFANSQPIPGGELTDTALLASTDVAPVGLVSSLQVAPSEDGTGQAALLVRICNFSRLTRTLPSPYELEVIGLR